MGLTLTPEQRRRLKLPAKRSKYNNVRTTVDDPKLGPVTLASKREAARYRELMIARDLGECWFLRQPTFHLPGGVRYVADFLVVWRDYLLVVPVTVEDVKGVKTPTYKLKKRQVEQIYGIKIVEV